MNLRSCYTLLSRDESPFKLFRERDAGCGTLTQPILCKARSDRTGVLGHRLGRVPELFHHVGSLDRPLLAWKSKDSDLDEPIYFIPCDYARDSGHLDIYQS